MIDVLFDMETSDPDDVLTLCFLTSHPDINLRAVTITPGSDHQVGLIRKTLELLNSVVPIGANGHDKECVSEFHNKWIKFVADKPNDKAENIINEALTKYPDLVLLTGGPLKNIHKFINANENFVLKRWVAQGGFAGDNIVPEKYRLAKFAGKITCPTFNFNGDPQGALLALNSKNIIRKELVSKNVCHGLCYDDEMHKIVTPIKDKTLGLSLLHKGMDIYLRKNKSGKLFHDPLAAATIVNTEICEYREVEMFRERGEWGSKPKDSTNTFISIKANREKFIQTLIA